MIWLCLPALNVGEYLDGKVTRPLCAARLRVLRERHARKAVTVLQ